MCSVFLPRGSAVGGALSTQPFFEYRKQLQAVTSKVDLSTKPFSHVPHERTEITSNPLGVCGGGGGHAGGWRAS